MVLKRSALAGAMLASAKVLLASAKVLLAGAPQRVGAEILTAASGSPFALSGSDSHCH